MRSLNLNSPVAPEQLSPSADLDVSPSTTSSFPTTPVESSPTTPRSSDSLFHQQTDYGVPNSIGLGLSSQSIMMSTIQKSSQEAYWNEPNCMLRDNLPHNQASTLRPCERVPIRSPSIGFPPGLGVEHRRMATLDWHQHAIPEPSGWPNSTPPLDCRPFAPCDFDLSNPGSMDFGRVGSAIGTSINCRQQHSSTANEVCQAAYV